MSYRELRNFTEIMRSLGYPRLISMENFRRPNFELVADILYWMVKLYDPDTTISDRVEFENERVEFLTGIAALMATKARLKLNTKKLYASDGRAVQELLKLATLLYKATQTVSKKNVEDTVPQPIKMQDVKTARQLASDITQSGAKLYDLMENEANDKIERARALRFLDQAASTAEGPREQQFIERSIRDIIEATKQALEDARKESEELEADERNLEAKISKKQDELERTEKRLKNLENVKPQFMEEAEKLEKELQRYYDIYMEKHRNLDYLEHELDKYRRNEEERMAEHERKLRKMRERLLKEEVELMRGGVRGDDDADDRYGGNRNEYGGRSESKRVETHVQGSMNGPRNGYRANSGGSGGGRRAMSDNESSDEDSSTANGTGNTGQGARGGRSADTDEDEELSVGNKNLRHASNGRTMGRGGGGGAKARDEDEFLDDDDDDDDDDDGEDDGDVDGEFSGSDGDF